MACIEDLTDLAHKIRLHLEAERAGGREPVNGRKIVLAVKAAPDDVRLALARLRGEGVLERVGKSEYRLTAPAATAPAGEQAHAEHVEAQAHPFTPGGIKDRVLTALAKGAMRNKDLVDLIGTNSVAPALTDLVRRGLVVRTAGVYSLPGAPALGWQRDVSHSGTTHVVVPATAAEQALVAELATLRAADAEVRALVQAKDGQDTASAVVRHLAKLDHHVEVARASARKTAAEIVEARRGCERLRREAVAATATRNEAQRGGATGKTDAPPTERVVAELVYASPDYMDKVFARARSVDGLETSLGARDIAEGVAADEFRRVMRLPPRHTVKLTDITDALAAKVGHLDDIARAFGTPDLNHLLLAAEARSLVRQVKALEKVAQRQPVAPGPRLLHPLGHPAVTAATVAAVGKLCCDANAAAIDDLRDGLAIDDDADMAEVVAVVLASRKADHAAIAELRAELADTRRRLTLAQCDASAQRAKVERGLGQRLLAAIRRGVGA